jgi:hypothetical protein
MGLFRRQTYVVYRPPMSLEARRRGMRIYLWMLLLGLLACIGLTAFPGFCTTGPQVIPWIIEHIGPGTNNPAQAHAASTGAHSPGGSIVGGPSLAPAFVNQVLAQVHSPAQGTGQALYELSKQYQIDDAFALAFFKAESQYGTTGMARITKSLGNIRCAGYASCINGYRAYASWAQGYQDWYQLIRNLYISRWHLTTVAQIVPVYAPASDGNDPASYIALVKQMVRQWWKGQVQA